MYSSSASAHSGYKNDLPDLYSQYSQSKADINARQADELGDVDVWAAEEAMKQAEDAQNRTWSAIGKLSGGREVGGGAYSSLFGGNRGAVNLSGLTGGLTAANLAKVSAAKKADIAGDTAAAEAAEKGKYDAAMRSYLTQMGYSGEEVDSLLSGQYLTKSIGNDAAKAQGYAQRTGLDQYGNLVSQKNYSSQGVGNWENF